MQVQVSPPPVSTSPVVRRCGWSAVWPAAASAAGAATPCPTPPPTGRGRAGGADAVRRWPDRRRRVPHWPTPPLTLRWWSPCGWCGWASWWRLVWPAVGRSAGRGRPPTTRRRSTWGGATRGEWDTPTPNTRPTPVERSEPARWQNGASISRNLSQAIQTALARSFEVGKM